jgi:hypothetical protein
MVTMNVAIVRHGSDVSGVLAENWQQRSISSGWKSSLLICTHSCSLPSRAESVGTLQEYYDALTFIAACVTAMREQ